MPIELTAESDITVDLTLSHTGIPPFDGTVHTEDRATRLAIDEGFLEEVLMHEAAHVSLDMEHREAPPWLAAQQADRAFISDYAEEFPGREDVAESILPYFAIRYKPAQLTELQRWHMTMTPPNRWDYFDGLELDMSPYTPQPHVVTVPPETVTPPVVAGGRRFEDPPIPRPRGR